MGMYRKKPVVIEARQFVQGNGDELAEWSGGKHERWERTAPECPQLHITTLEGVMRAELNDWIIKGVNGEFYPCKPDIFEKTYDVVEGES